MLGMYIVIKQLHAARQACRRREGANSATLSSAAEHGRVRCLYDGLIPIVKIDRPVISIDVSIQIARHESIWPLYDPKLTRRAVVYSFFDHTKIERYNTEILSQISRPRE